MPYHVSVKYTGVGHHLMAKRYRVDKTIHGGDTITYLGSELPLCRHEHDTPEEARQCPQAKAARHFYR